MLTKLRLRNFKAFEELDLEFTPLTFFVGPNNSGKSSIIAAPRLLAQTVESPDSTIPLLLNGSLGDFGTYRDIVYLNHRGRRLEINFQLHIDRPRHLVEQLDSNELNVSLAYKYRAKRRELILKDLQISSKNRPLLATTYSEDSERQLIQQIGGKSVPSSVKAALTRAIVMQNFLPQHVSMFAARNASSGPLREFESEEVEDTLRSVNRLSRATYSYFRDIEYLSATRIPPERTQLFTGEKRHRIGATGENAANILAMDSMRGGSRSRSIGTNVSDWLNKAGIASKLEILPLSDRHYEIRVQHPMTGEYQNFADVGYGHSQILPVLVGGFNLQQNATFLVEEPEIHLHPRAQAELGDFFLSLYENGVQSIVETHSEHLILRLQQYVASGQIPSQDIRLYYVHATSRSKKVTPLRLDDGGYFVDEWPEGFFPERLEEAKKLAKVRYQKEN